MPVTFQAINKFAQARPPGIYKQDYIDALYMLFNEKKPENLVCPQTPEWKSLPDPDYHGVSVSATDNYTDILKQVRAHSHLHNMVIFSDNMMVAVCVHMILPV
jgi:mRNA-capping enzyme